MGLAFDEGDKIWSCMRVYNSSTKSLSLEEKRTLLVYQIKGVLAIPKINEVINSG